MARGFAAVLSPADLTVIVNVGDDDTIYGVHVSADVDTMVYTLAGIESEHGWGIRGDTFALMEHLGALGVDATFRLGDRDFAHCLFRTLHLRSGGTLGEATALLASSLGVEAAVVPASDDPVRTKVRIEDGSWLDFQDYFVGRRHEPRVTGLRYEGAAEARPVARAIEAIEAADLVVIAPSNPPLSIHPILAIPGYREALASKELVVAVSPLVGGAAVKGPAAEVMAAMDYPADSRGVAAAYSGLISDLVVMTGDGRDVAGVSVHERDTMIGTRLSSSRLAAQILDIAGNRASRTVPTPPPEESAAAP
jgi:LPPG:FO 2-phospho-L-lactate transferase